MGEPQTARNAFTECQYLLGSGADPGPTDMPKKPAAQPVAQIEEEGLLEEEIEEVVPVRPAAQDLPDVQRVTFLVNSELGEIEEEEEAEDDGLGEDRDEEDEEDGEDGEEYEDDMDIDDDPLAVAVHQLSQHLRTEEGETLGDLLGGVRDSLEATTELLAGLREALDKQNKILYRGLQIVEEQARKPKGGR